jgi:hypothetical protein
MYYLVADPVLERLEDCYARILLSSAISGSREDLRWLEAHERGRRRGDSIVMVDSQNSLELDSRLTPEKHKAKLVLRMSMPIVYRTTTRLTA